MPLTTIDPTPALVVIDLQRGIVSGPVAHVVPQAAALANAFRRHDLPVVLVNVTGRAPGRTDAGPAAKAAPAPCPQAGRTSSTSSTGSRATT
jgi:nicotinamidase-related amidase